MKTYIDTRYIEVLSCLPADDREAVKAYVEQDRAKVSRVREFWRG